MDSMDAGSFSSLADIGHACDCRIEGQQKGKKKHDQSAHVCMLTQQNCYSGLKRLDFDCAPHANAHKKGHPKVAFFEAFDLRRLERVAYAEAPTGSVRPGSNRCATTGVRQYLSGSKIVVGQTLITAI